MIVREAFLAIPNVTSSMKWNHRSRSGGYRVATNVAFALLQGNFQCPKNCHGKNMAKQFCMAIAWQTKIDTWLNVEIQFFVKKQNFAFFMAFSWQSQNAYLAKHGNVSDNHIIFFQ